MQTLVRDYFSLPAAGVLPVDRLDAPWLATLGFVLSVLAALAAFGLGGRAARTRLAQRWTWRSLAALLLAVAIELPIWATLAAHSPSLLPSLPTALLAFATSFASALCALALAAHDGHPRWRHELPAATALALAVAAGLLLNPIEPVLAGVLSFEPQRWAIALGIAALGPALALRLAQFGRPRRLHGPTPAALPAAVLLAAAASAGQAAMLAAAGWSRAAALPGHAPDWPDVVLPLLGLGVLVAVLLVRLFERRGDRSLHDYRARLRREHRFEPITGLPTASVLGESFLRLQRTALATRSDVAVAVVQLTGLDRVLASHGATERDQIYSLAAWRLRTVRREDELLGVLGDERFVLVLRVPDAGAAAARLREAIALFEPPLRDEGVQIRVRPQVGISLWPTQGEHFDRLLSNALVALERSRPGMVQVYLAAHRQESERRGQIEAELAAALSAGELTAVFQPVLDLRQNRVAAVEMLARWHSATIGDVAPEQFVLIAESTGMIGQFDRWLLREAVATLRWLDAAGFDQLRIAVNVSPLNLADPEFADFVESLLASLPLAPDRFEVEITEAAIAEGDRTVLDTMVRLRALGLSLTIDDFGVGHSSLARLRDLPVGRLKIDRSFVRDSDHPQGEQMITGIIGLAHGLGLEVIAEGIETDSQRVLLGELGCEYLQGFLLSKPLSWRGLLDFLGEPKAAAEHASPSSAAEGLGSRA